MKTQELLDYLTGRAPLKRALLDKEKEIVTLENKFQVGKRRMNWEAFDIAAELLVKKVKGQNFTCIYGQPRGGLILAVMLSHKLGLPLSLTPYSSMLWCDDIVDSGNTYLKMKQKFPKAIYCSLLAKKFQNEVLHAFDYSDKNEWVVFPWETKESTEGQ